MEAMEDDSDLPNDPEELQSCIENWEAMTSELTERIFDEDSKMEKYRVSGCTPKMSLILILLSPLAGEYSSQAQLPPTHHGDTQDSG